MDWRDSPFHFDQDLDQRVGFIAGVPRNNPSISLDEFVEELRSATEAALPDVHDGHGFQFTIEKYQIGSAAEWTQTFAVLTNVAPVIISHGADLITWALAIREAIVSIRGYVHKREASSELIPGLKAPEPIVTMPYVLGMCLSHFQQTVGNLDKITISGCVRSSKNYLSSAAHPAGFEIYTVGIKSGTATYVFVVQANGECVDHFVIKGGTVSGLTVPDWLHDRVTAHESNEDFPPVRF